MSTPRLTEVFLIKEAADQHWTSNGNRFHVGKLYDYAKSVTVPRNVPVSELQYGFEHTNCDEPKWSDEFMERAKAAGDDPILVVIDDKGVKWIADGNHRFGRSMGRGDEHIMGLVVHERDLPQGAIDPK